MVHLKGIKNILFDFGGVLVDLDRQACLDAFKALGIDVEPLLSLYGHKGPFGQVENGEISLEQFRADIRSQFGVNPTDDQIDQAWGAFLLNIPVNKMKMVHELAKTYRVFLLSNTNPVHIRKLEEFQDKGYPVNECFEKLYLSFELGLSKPGREIFEYVLNDAGLVPEETLFVDDGPANCRMAEQMGIKTYQPEPFEDFTGLLLRPEACVATMGFFDGLHLGHQYLVGETKQWAAKQGLPSMLISFWPHPRMVIQTDFCPQLLTERFEREALIGKMGVDYSCTLAFDHSLAALSARDFMQQILKDELHVKTLVIGFDHRFGNSRSDDFSDYKRYGEAMGMEVIQCSPFQNFLNVADAKHKTISSSFIRRLILAGNLEQAAQALGRPYSLTGTVVGGHHIGTGLGYPTANLEPLSVFKLIPPMGIYAVWVDYRGQAYKGMMSIGKRPTLHTDSTIVMEVHLLHFSGNLYGEKLTVRFMKRFRMEEHFPDVESLVAKMREDELYVEGYLKP